MNINAKSFLAGIVSMLIPAILLDYATHDIAPFACMFGVLFAGSIAYLWGSHEVYGAYYDGWYDGYDSRKEDETQPTTEEPKKENHE